MRQDLRVVLRLFDSDFERNFGMKISQSVSYLAAPAFAAAMLDRQVLGHDPGRPPGPAHAEVPIKADFEITRAVWRDPLVTLKHGPTALPRPRRCR